MIYLVAGFGVVFVAVWCFVLDSAQARIMFLLYRGFGMTRDRDGFVHGYRLFIRTLGVIMICGIGVGLVLR
jgi:hypothetical protein